METVKHPVHFIDEFFTEVQYLKVLVVERFFNEYGYMKHIDPKKEPNWPYKKAKFLSIDQYAQRESNYEAEITKLQEKALNEAMFLNEFQLNNIINRTQFLIDKYKSFWPKYSELCALNRAGRLNMSDIELLIYPFFIVDKHEHGSITQEFIDRFHDAVMFKQGALLAFKRSLDLAIKKPGIIEPQCDSLEKIPESISSVVKQDPIINPMYQESFNKFVDILKQTDPIVLDVNGQLLMEKGKNIIVTWLKLLGSKGVVSIYNLSPTEKVAFVKTVIPGLEISISTFKKKNTIAANELYSFIEREIESIKKEIAKLNS